MRRVWLVTPIALCLAGCSNEAPASGSFAELFPEQQRIELQEDPADPIVGISALSVASNGRLIVTDMAASRVRIFSEDGTLLKTLGALGEGPGELQAPTWAAAGSQGEFRVVEQGSPRLTTFWSDDSVSVTTLPGHYGFWIAPLGDKWAVGAATQTTRFAVLTGDATDAVSSFGAPPGAVAETPFWIFFAKDRGAVFRNQVWINNSFSPTLRVFDSVGDEVGSFGEPPTRWVAPSPPPIDRIDAPGDRERLEAWSRSFTVVTSLSNRADSLVVVQYGTHEPTPQEPYNTTPRWIDVYGPDGVKLHEGIGLNAPILAGGEQLFVLVAVPPAPWTIAMH